LCDLHVLVYSRHAAGESFWILLNFTDQPRQFRHSDLRGAIILSTALDRWRLLMRSSLCARMKASSSKWMGEMPGVKEPAAVDDGATVSTKSLGSYPCLCGEPVCAF
jgi:hypothetical protein